MNFPSRKRFLTKQQYDGDAEGYRMSVRAAVYGLWRGEFSLQDFVDQMVLAIETYFTRAWYEGMSACGIQPDEITTEERIRLIQEINTEYQYIVGFGEDILRNSRENGGKLAPLVARIPMWVNRYINVRETAKTYACNDMKFEWVVNPLKESCEDCLMLNGRVHRGSVWKASGWAPRSRNLACGGYKCGCELVATDKPALPGRPPQMLKEKRLHGQRI